uniref:5'-deoxynucleotidase HDDC2 n=1 Tax=Panagrellus redivivus TaxID=6233 RepID=A0A7E5A1G6_PANRE
MSKSTQIFDLLNVLDNLKHLVRTGWKHFEIPEPETVAGHMYRMAVLAMALAGEDPSLDIVRCVKMALVHDIGEAIVGDITPRCGVSEETKFTLEENAVLKIASYVGPAVGDEWEALWREYEAASTPEAKAVKQLDKFDMVAQAATYEKKYGIDLSEFFNTTTKAFSTEPFLTWNRELRERRTVEKSEKRELA